MSDETIPTKLSYKDSPTFRREFASGVVVSGPTPQGNIMLTFYEDAVSITAETLTPTGEEGQFKNTFEEGDVVRFRENRVAVSLPVQTAYELLKILDARFEDIIESEQPAADSDD